MDSYSPLHETKRKTPFEAPLVQQTFTEVVGRDQTFLDEPSFQHKGEVAKYFDGTQDLPASNVKEFLTVLQAVLEATQSDVWEEADPIKGTVREKFLALYDTNSETLQQTMHVVHKEVASLDRYEEEEDFGRYGEEAFATDPMEVEIQNYLDEEVGSELIGKYFAKRSPANPTAPENAKEFYQLYAVVLRTCPKAPLMSVSGSTAVVPSGRETLRSDFDVLYERHQRELAQVWDKTGYVREIEQLRAMPFPSDFRGFPTMTYRSGHGYPLPPSMGMPMSPYAMPLRVSFRDLQSQYGSFDFSEYGLEDSSLRIIVFFNGKPESGLTPPNFPYTERDFFTVLKIVLTQLKGVDEGEDLFAAVIKRRFIELYQEASTLPEQLGGLNPSQALEIQTLGYPPPRRVSFGPPNSYGTPFDPTSFGKGVPKGMRKRTPSSGGGGGSFFVKATLLLLVGYLGYRYVAQPTYQWIRGNKTTSVRE